MSIKSDVENWLDTTIIGASITIFALLASLRSEILSSNIALSLQLVMVLPLLVFCIFAQKKKAESGIKEKWTRLSDICFTVGYGFFINSIGILFSYFVPISVVLVFFISNIIISLIKQYLRVYEENKESLYRSIARELLSILLVIILGILPSLNNY